MKLSAVRTAAIAFAAATLSAALLARPADACTRVLYVAPDGTVITGRSMDWAEDMRSNIWALPAGMARDGAGGANTLKWTSKYGSVVVTGYDIGTAEGMNEKGLVANMLYLAESDYGTPDGTKPVLSIAAWGQYALDSFATVAEAVEALRAEPFRIAAPILPNGRGAQLHMALSDDTGDSAIFEYIGGKLVIHHGKQYVVMTNSPSYDQQLAIEKYWQGVGGLQFLPGTNRAADRFARAAFFLNAIPRQADPDYIGGVPGQTFYRQAMASVLSVMRSVGVPLGITTPNQPNISSTIWRTISDNKHRVMLFDAVASPSAFWIPLEDLDLKPGAPVMKLQLAGGQTYEGNAADDFKPAPMFTFLPADAKGPAKTAK